LIGGISFTSGSFYTKFVTTIIRLNNLSLPQPVLTITNPSMVCNPATVDITDASIITGSDAYLKYTYWTDALATNSILNPRNNIFAKTYRGRAIQS
jgi:hypothetical protein